MRTRSCLVVLLAGLVVSCGDDDEAGASGAVESKLRECELATGGGKVSVGTSEVEQCVARCQADATCQELEAALCDGRLSDRLMDCQAACFGPFDCADGSGRYTLRERCDRDMDCDDGSDERGCPAEDDRDDDGPEYCDESGSRIFPFQRCDGVDDCGDGTDERDCPAEPDRFTCERGFGGVVRQIPAERVCDLFPDCPDGSDESVEQGCLQLMCE